MIRPAADDARTKPLKIGTRSGNIRLAFNLPSTVRRQKFAEVFAGFSADADAAMRQVVRPHEHLVVFFGMDLRPGFQQSDVEAAFGENFRSHAAAGSGADDANIIRLR